jgi:hypothetical protein
MKPTRFLPATISRHFPAKELAMRLFADRPSKRIASRSMSSRRRSRLGRRLGERLEDRRLLAITAEFNGGVLTFTGDGADNDLVITAADNASTTLSFSSPTDTISLVGGTTNPQGSVSSVVVALGNGTDSLTINGTADADTFALAGLTLTYAAVPYSLDADLEQLIVESHAGGDDFSLSGNSTSLNTDVEAGADVDSFVIGNWDTGSFALDGDGTFPGNRQIDSIQVSAALVQTQGNQFYFAPVTVAADVAFESGGEIRFSESINGAFDVDFTSGNQVTFSEPVGAVTPLATLDITAAFDLEIEEDVTVDGDISLMVPEAAPGSQLESVSVHNAAVLRSLSGQIDIIAGDGIFLQENTEVHAATTLTLRAGFNSNDDTAGVTRVEGVSSTGGGPNSFQAIGTAGDDAFTVGRFPQSTLTILGGGGSDVFTVDAGDGDDTIDVFATQVNSRDNALATDVVYVQIETLRINGQEGDDDVYLQLPVTPLESLPIVNIEGDQDGGFDRVKVTGTPGNDIIVIGRNLVGNPDPIQIRFMDNVQVFGLHGDDFLWNKTINSSVLLDGGFGNDRLIGGVFSDILFGGDGGDWLEGGDGHDLLYADYDYNFGNPVQAARDYDKLDGGLGFDVLLALGIDHLVQETQGDTSRDRVVGNRQSLVFDAILMANFIELTNQSIAETLQLRLNLPAGHPIP